MPNISFPEEELVQDDDKMTLEIEKRRTETEKKIYFALKAILRKNHDSLTLEDKQFLQARKSYLTKAELQEYADVLAENVFGNAGPAPKVEKKLEDYTRPELEEMARELGVVEPDKLPNKAAVADAIRAAKEAQQG